jgi:hypothetical protein
MLGGGFSSCLVEGDVCHMMCKVSDVDWCVVDQHDTYRSMQTWEQAIQGSREQELRACAATEQAVLQVCR